MQTQAETRASSRRVTRASIDLDAISHNLRLVRDAVGPRVRILAVVKANAYGHGSVEVARRCLEAGADWLGVGTVEEGLTLRRGGLHAPVLVLGPSVPEEHGDALAHGLTLAVGSLSMAARLADTARSLGLTAHVHAKVDTGLSRFGMRAADAVEQIAALSTLPGLRLDGVFTHLAASEEADKSSAQAQMAVFAEVLAALDHRGIETGLRHAANSAAALELPETRLDLVRAGIVLFGYHPAGFGAEPGGLRPALTLHTRLARVHEAPTGTGVGYNHTYRTTRPTLLGLAPIGYADGLPRLLSNRGHMLVGGTRCPIVGSVAMDQTILDVSGVPGVAEGDPVVVIGAQGAERIGADEIGVLAGSNAYETLCRLSSRVPRDYHG